MSSSAEQDGRWRDPYEVVAGWEDAGGVSPSLLRHRVSGGWWDALERADSTLLVSREYEHLLLALTVAEGRPRISFMPLPHPSGIAYDPRRRVVHVASTRNPNQILELSPVTRLLPRADLRAAPPAERPLVPIRSRFLPGALYIHDLAMVGDKLHASAVGENAVIRLDPDAPRRVWWPRCVERGDAPAFDRNYLQLNSIAAGRGVRSSFYSASAESTSARRPGHRNFPVDGRGVIFSGKTREPYARGLTRPHSARLHDRRLWVDNSGYGQAGVIEDGRFEPLATLPGWTRGLAFGGGIAFVGASRILPRFQHYAPGLEPERCRCAVHALDAESGRSLGRIEWPEGDQVFATELVPRRLTLGFPLTRPGHRDRRARDVFYAFDPRP